VTFGGSLEARWRPPWSLSLWKGRTVRTWAEHNAVVSATRMANGVTDVIDELEVTS